MPVDECSVVGSPVGHNSVYVLKAVFSGKNGGEPCGGPCFVGSVEEYSVDIFGQLYGISLNYLNGGSKSFYKINSREGAGHNSLCGIA